MDLKILSKYLYLLVWIQSVKCWTTPSEGCLDPGPIENGSRDPPAIEGYLPQNTVIRFTCNEDHTHKGAMKIYCDAANRWVPTNNVPECIANTYCQDPGIHYGHVLGVTVTGYHDRYVVNTEASLSCETGFTISTTGESINRCGEDGLWYYTWAHCQDIDECASNICKNGGLCINQIGSYKCHCTTGYDGTNCENERVEGCSEPNNVTNANKDFSREPSPETGLYYRDSSVIYTCKSGYKMTGSSELFCTDGHWEGGYPKCEITCGVPPTVPHSSFYPKSDSYLSGDQVVYTCDDGFSRRGSDRVTCGSGNWSGTGRTTCVPEHYCPDPGVPENGDRCCQDVFIPGVEISFYCEDDYKLVGVSEIVCQSDGSWDSDLEPLCVLASSDIPQSGDHMLTNETFTIVVAISGSIMGILTVTVILSIRECCTQRRRRSHCRYHSSSIAARVARMRERHHSHLMSLTSNMEVPLPSYEEATAGQQPTSGDGSAQESQPAGNGDVPPELPPRPPHMIQVQPEAANSNPQSAINTSSPPIPRSNRIPPWRRRRRISQERQSVNTPLLENSSELDELPHSRNPQQDSDQPLISVLNETRNDADIVSLESGVISDQHDEDGSGISAIAGELTPSGSSESLSTFEGIPLQQQT